MTITVKKITEVIPNDYMGNDRTWFEDEQGVTAYTFGKIFEGQSYEGSYKPDKRGQTQFKKTPDSTFQNTSNNQSAPRPSQSQGNSASVEQFTKAVDKFAASVTELANLLSGEKQVKTEISAEDVADFLGGDVVDDLEGSE